MKRDSFEALYFAEIDQAERDAGRLIDGLSSVATAVEDAELADAVRAKLTEASGQIVRLREIADRPAAGDAGPSDPVACLVDRVTEITRAMPAGPVRDSALIAAIQHIQHHQIATYGTLAAHAKALGRHDDKRVFGAMLEEERAIDEDLTVIAYGLMEPLGELAPA